MKEDFIIACPTCKKSQRWKECGEYKPFCSKRCQLIDLGEWASEGHAIAGEPVQLPDDQSSEH